MTTKSTGSQAADSKAPFGTEPRRSPGPLVFYGLLYLAWVALLLWMAVCKPGN